MKLKNIYSICAICLAIMVLVLFISPADSLYEGLCQGTASIVEKETDCCNGAYAINNGTYDGMYKCK